MIQTKTFSHQKDLRKSIKNLVNNLYEHSKQSDDQLPMNGESVASYVCKRNQADLNRSFLDYCEAVKHYSKEG